MVKKKRVKHRKISKKSKHKQIKKRIKHKSLSRVKKHNIKHKKKKPSLIKRIFKPSSRNKFKKFGSERNHTVISEERAKQVQKLLCDVKTEIAKVVIGQSTIIDGLLRTLLCGGHSLVEGVPGIAKTLIVKTLAAVTHCNHKRIQFTADLLPSDIIGTTVYNELKKTFDVVKGPLFANFILADEINRAPPKVQSALLEAMQEKQVTIGRETFKLVEPFFVLATENPIEYLGVYQLPEAQVDRFLFKLYIHYPEKKEEQIILKNNISLWNFEDYKIKPILSTKKIMQLQKWSKQIYLSKEIEKYIIEIIDSTRNPTNYGLKLGKYIEWGSSPRASISLFIAAKADALLNGKNYVIPQNVKNVAPDVLRHRIMIKYEGEAEGVTSDDVIKEILKKVKVP